MGADPPAAPATLAAFAAANDAVMATTRKLQKQAALGEYFRPLADEDLRRAVRYAGGRAFAATDPRALNVGGAIVSEALLTLLRLDPGDYHDRVVRSGEIGEALSAIWPDGGFPTGPEVGATSTASAATAGSATLPAVMIATPAAAVTATASGATAAASTGGTAEPSPARPPLSLGDLDAAFAELAATGNVERKRAALVALFSRCVGGREAAYLAKIIFGDLRTGAREGVLQAAVAEAFAKPPADIRRGHLLLGDLGEVAVLARHDALAAARFRLFRPIQCMLATAAESPADAAATMAGRAFWAEDKLDGIRAQAHRSPAGVALYTRDLARVDEAFPDVAAALARLPGEFLLDGEIVPYRAGVVLPFAHIQKRLGRKAVSARVLADHPAAFIAFDILYRDGRLLMDLPLRERREVLQALASSLASSAASSPAEGEGPALLVSAPAEVTTAEQVAAAFEAARGRRNEGVVLKDPASAYQPGRRGQSWLKLKTHLPTLDCVVTAAETGHGKRRNWLSDYTFAVWDRPPSDEGSRLVNIGKAYSGLTDEEIARLTELFTTLTVRQFGRVRLVEPRVVLEIAFDTIQKSARHSGGYALRFPRIKRIRADKRPEDADLLGRVEEVYASKANFGQSVLETAPTLPESPPPEPTLFD